MTIVYTVAHLSDELAQAWLQHLRDFDIAHPGCHFEVAVDAPEGTLEDAVRTLKSVKPGFPHIRVYKRKTGKMKKKSRGPRKSR